jgi:hypothetical protein
MISACEVVDLESPESDLSSDEKEQISSSNIKNTDSVSFRMLITGNQNKSWIANDFTLAGSDNLTFCRLDDELKFNADGTYNYDGGSQLCGAEDDSRIKSGTWKVLYSENKILFDEGLSNEYSADIIGLSESEIRLKGNYFTMEVRGKYSKK